MNIKVAAFTVSEKSSNTPLYFLNSNFTVLPAKSDSDVMFCLQSYQWLRSIDHLCINPIHRINTQVIYRFALA